MGHIEREGIIMQECLVLVKPTKEYADDAIRYREECLELDGEIDGAKEFAEVETYTDWLECLKKKQNLIEGIPSSETYFVVCEGDDKVIGVVEIRPHTQLLQDNIGNISLSIRPCYRGEGYGRQAFALALEACKKIGMRQVTIVCKEESIRMARLVSSNGGVGNQEQQPREYRRFYMSL